MSRGKAVADWAAAVPPERAMAPAVPGRRPHWPLRAAPALGWHCRPVPPAVRCSAGGPSSAGSPTCGARKPAPGWVRPPPAVPPATVASAVSMQTRPTLHQNPYHRLPRYHRYILCRNCTGCWRRSAGPANCPDPAGPPTKRSNAPRRAHCRPRCSDRRSAAAIGYD